MWEILYHVDLVVRYIVPVETIIDLTYEIVHNPNTGGVGFGGNSTLSFWREGASAAREADEPSHIPALRFGAKRCVCADLLFACRA